MPAPKKGPRLGGSPAHQKAILANLATSLFHYGSITTTEAKAKTLRPFAEKLITKAKRGDLHNRRQVMSVIRDKSVVHALFTEIGPRYGERPGGYTRITKLGPRKGDNAPMAVIELVEAEFTPTVRSARRQPPGAAATQQPAEPTAPPTAEAAPDEGGEPAPSTPETTTGQAEEAAVEIADTEAAYEEAAADASAPTLADSARATEALAGEGAEHAEQPTTAPIADSVETQEADAQAAEEAAAAEPPDDAPAEDTTPAPLVDEGESQSDGDEPKSENAESADDEPKTESE